MLQEEEKTGTTIMAIKYNNGVLVGADTRTSMGTYISSRVTDKLTRLSDTIYCCRSGSSADTQVIADYVSNFLQKYSHLENERPSVNKAAVLARNIVYKYPSLSASLIIAGFDTQPRVFKISLGGALVECNWTIGGSGSAFIYGYCDQNYRPNMTLDEAINFVKQAVGCAIFRDNSSGGCIRLAAITESGVQRYLCTGNMVPECI